MYLCIRNMSSYEKNKYNNIFKAITFSQNPSKIVEFGILKGYSLDAFIQGSNESCKIEAFDIFDDFNGNSANYEDTINKYKLYPNVKIKKGDFYKEYKNIDDNSIDILHIDIANDGDTYKFCLENYYNKIVDNGLIILEGGSKARDNVEWMLKYNKMSIKEYVNSLKGKYKILIIDDFPSVTIIKKTKV